MTRKNKGKKKKANRKGRSKAHGSDSEVEETRDGAHRLLARELCVVIEKAEKAKALKKASGLSDDSDDEDPQEILNSFANHKIHMTLMYMPLIRNVFGKGTSASMGTNPEECMEIFRQGSSPNITLITCGSGDGPDEVFCIWLCYEDILSHLNRDGWTAPPFMPFPLPFGLEGHKSLGQCLVASKDISAGDLIACERPILIMPVRPQGLEARAMENSLEEMFYRLKGKIRGYLNNIKFPGLPMASSLGKKLFWLVSNFGSLVKFTESEHLPFYHAFFPVISRCCHSCGPNAVVNFDTDSLVMELRALREIKPGEKITITYCDPLLDFQSRQEELRRRFNFQCTCRYCNSSRINKEEDSSYESSRRNRTSNYNRDQLSLFTSELYEEMLKPEKGEPDLDHLIMALKGAIEFADKESLQMFSYLHVRYLVQIYASLGDIKNARHWGEVAMRLSICEDIGKDAYYLRGTWGMFLLDLTVHPLWCTNKKSVSARDLALAWNKPLNKDKLPDGLKLSTALSYGAIKYADWTLPNVEKQREKDRDTEMERPPSSEDLMSALMKSGYPKLVSLECRTGDDADRTFCVWVAYYDIVETLRQRIPWPSIPSNPKEPYYIDNVEGIGTAMFASRSIEAGELIIAERPLVLTPVEHMYQEEQLDKIVEYLDPEKYALLMSLPDHQLESQATKMQRIIESNSISVQFPQSRFLPWYQGVFPTICRCNHSCSPNAIYAFDASILVMELRATRRIRQGEQITFAYYNILEDYETRQSNLFQKFGFTCICSQCQVRYNDRKSDELRRRILDGMCLRYPAADQDLFDQIRAYKDILYAIDRENVQLFKHRFVRLLVRAYAVVGDIHNLKYWVKMAATTCLTSFEGVKAFRQQAYWLNLLEDVKKHPDWNTYTYIRRTEMLKIDYPS